MGALVKALVVVPLLPLCLEGIAVTCIMMLFASTVAVNHYGEAAQTLHELCKAKNRPVHAFEESESELLVINSTMDLETRQLVYQRHKNRCRLEFKVCPSCHFEIAIKNMTISSCSPPECWCGYFEIQEPLSQYRLKYCGNSNESVLHFESKTRLIYVDFVQNENLFYVVLNITSRRNHYTITGMPTDENFIESPFFPMKYPPDYSAEYTFHSLDPKGHVHLLFLDFQLLPNSYIEVSGHNGHRTDTYAGDVFRPPPFASQSIQLRLKFEANSRHATKAGFRAKYTFVRSDWDFLLETPNTNCGGSRESYGGAISLSAPSGVGQLVDCIWLIYPPLFSHGKLFSAMLAESKNIGTGSFLELRKGLTSVSSVIKKFECYIPDCFIDAQNLEITSSASLGVYIRFRGHITKESSITISYCTFSEMDCNDGEFECTNGRCIQRFLFCDGYNHCLDNSDEAEEKCKVQSVTTTSKSTRITRAPNIVKEEFPAVLITIIFLMAASGVSIVILAVVLIVNKCVKPRPLRRESLRRVSRRRGSPLAQLILDVADESPELPALGNVDSPPPSYEDVLKCARMFPRLSYTSQNDAETNCSFTDFQVTGNEASCSGCENPASLDVLQDSELLFKSPVAACNRHASLGSIPDAAHLVPVSSPCSLKSTRSKCNQESSDTSRRLCQSLDSKLNHCCCHQRPHSYTRVHMVEPEYVVLQPVPYKHARCMTLPSDYKLPQRGKTSDSNCGSSKSIPEADEHFPCSSDARAENKLPQCTCALISGIPGVINAEILPVVRNRCSSASCQLTVVGLHSCSRKKASTF